MSLIDTLNRFTKDLYSRNLLFSIMKLRKLNFIIFLLLIVFLANSTFGAVEVFSNYDTVMKLNKNNTIDVHKIILLRNVHEVGIVPGQVEFKIGKSLYDSVSNVELLDYKVLDRYGNPIKSQISDTGQFSTILLDIFTPILPGFEYKIDLYYTLEYNPEGIFFKRLQVPLKEITQIPIKKGTVELIIPDSYHFTYLSYTDNDTIVQDNSVAWEINEDMPQTLTFEYSYLPIKVGNIQGSYIFWITINAILILILFFEIRKEIIRFKKD